MMLRTCKENRNHNYKKIDKVAIGNTYLGNVKYLQLSQINF